MSDIVERLRSRSRFDTCISPETLMAEAADEIERLRQRVKELGDYLREVAVEAGLPPETLDIATCRHVAHRVKAIRAASIQFMNEAAELRKAQGEPVAWIRFCSDGCYEGPIMHKQMEEVRKKSGAWTPLYQ